MKTLIIALSLVALAATAQEFKFLGFRCRDVALLHEQLAQAPDGGWHKHFLTYMLDFAQNGEPESLAAAKPRIEAAAKSIDPDTTDNRVLSLVKQYAYQNSFFTDELITFCKENPSDYDFYVALNGDDEWAFGILSQVLLEGKGNAGSTGMALEKVNSLSVKLNKDNATMHSLLSDCNRIYTGKLLKDKEAWADIVAQIRTLMDVYK